MKTTILISATLLLATLTTVLLDPLGNSSGRDSSALLPLADSRAGQEQQTPALETTELGRSQIEVETPPASRAAFFELPVGRRMQHTFETQAHSRTRLGDPAQTAETNMTISGNLEALVVARTDEAIALRMTLGSVQTSIEGTGLQSSEDAASDPARVLERSFYVRMAHDGRTLGYRFPQAMEAGVRNIYRSLWTALHCVVPEDETTTCTIEDADPSGAFLSHFTWLEAPGTEGIGLLEKRREPVAHHDDETLGSSAVGSGEATLLVDKRWFSEVRYEELGKLEKPDVGFSAEQSTTFHFQLQETDELPTGAIEPFDMEADWSPVSGYAEALAAAQASSNRRHPATEGKSLAQLLAELEALIATDEHLSREAYELLTALAERFRLDPSQLEELGELFEEGALTETAMSYALAAVGAAGTPEAQSFLAERISGEDASLQVAAIRSALQVDQPTAELLSTLRLLTESNDMGTELYGHSLLGLGALAGRADNAEYLAYLSSEDRHDGDTESLIVWLAALGNSGSAEILEHVQPYLGHDDADVRARAVAALRKLDDQAITDLLGDACFDDDDAGVAGTAIEILATRSDDAAQDIVAQILGNDPRASVRQRAIQGLANRAPRDDFAILMLSQVVQSDPDAALRELARSLLQG